MSRRRKATKRKIIPDPRYDSTLVGRLINILMISGKKSIAQKIVYGTFEKISEELEKGDPIDILLTAMENARPKLEIKSRRLGGSTYQVPVEVSFERQQSLALRWFVEAASKSKGKSTINSLSREILDAYNNTGSVVKKKDDIHRMAQANRAFAHLKW